MAISDEDQATLDFYDARPELAHAMAVFKEKAGADNRDLVEELQEVIDEVCGSEFDL